MNSAIRLEEWSFKRSTELKVTWFSLVKPLILLNYREYREHVKDLSCLSKNPCRVVLVDNNPFSFLLQPLNGIPCVPFTAGQPHDTQVSRFGFDITVCLKQIISSPSLHLFYHFTWWPASGCPPSTPKAPLSAERCETCALRKVPYAWVVSKARNP